MNNPWWATLCLVPPSLKSELNFLPQEGQAISIPPIFFGKRKRWPHLGHFFSVCSVIMVEFDKYLVNSFNDWFVLISVCYSFLPYDEPCETFQNKFHLPALFPGPFFLTATSLNVFLSFSEMHVRNGTIPGWSAHLTIVWALGKFLSAFSPQTVASEILMCATSDPCSSHSTIKGQRTRQDKIGALSVWFLNNIPLCSCQTVVQRKISISGMWTRQGL